MADGIRFSFSLRNAEPIRRLQALLRQGGTSAGPIGAFYKRVGFRYLTYMRARFREFSVGQGDWSPLKASTIRARIRRYGKKGAPKRRLLLKGMVVGAHKIWGFNTADFSGWNNILFVTGNLLRALTPGMPGNAFKRIYMGIEVGFSNSAQHTTAKMSFAKLAMIHQRGNPSKGLPSRPILAFPPSKFFADVRKDMRRAAFQMFGAAGAKSRFGDQIEPDDSGAPA